MINTLPLSLWQTLNQPQTFHQMNIHLNPNTTQSQPGLKAGPNLPTDYHLPVNLGWGGPGSLSRDYRLEMNMGRERKRETVTIKETPITIMYHQARQIQLLGGEVHC